MLICLNLVVSVCIYLYLFVCLPGYACVEVQNNNLQPDVTIKGGHFQVWHGHSSQETWKIWKPWSMSFDNWRHLISDSWWEIDEKLMIDDSWWSCKTCRSIWKKRIAVENSPKEDYYTVTIQGKWRRDWEPSAFYTLAILILACNVVCSRNMRLQMKYEFEGGSQGTLLTL